MKLDTLIRVGEARSDSFGFLKFPNFNFLIELAKVAKCETEQAESLLTVTENSTIRVKQEAPNSVFLLINHGNNWKEVAQLNQPMSSYKDDQHKQVRGGGYIEWRNGDFDQPLTPDLILSHLGWKRLMAYLSVSGRTIDNIFPTDELAACSV